MFDLKIMPVAKCGHVGACQSSPSGYASDLKNRYTYSEPTADRVADHALQKLEAARQLDIETHEKNLPAIENNKLIVAHVTQLMEAIGMPRSYRVRDFKSRARYPKYDNPTAGYLGDLQREVLVADGFEQATRTYESLLATYRKFKESAAEQAARAQRERETAAERERQARLANVELAEIILRYGLDRESDWSEVLEALCDKHQRADLAVAMMRVRNDWSDGPDAVSNAIDRFKIETDEDKEIANDIMRHLGDGWDHDGRCFRDTTWNYDRLLGSLPDQLAADVRTAWSRSTKDE
jgi:hypothetical protein